MVLLVAVEHLYILVLEMFLWTRPQGRKAFQLTPERAEATRVMAANQGLYNGFLAAGLLWGLFTGNTSNQLFFLGCVVLAGLYGGMTASRRIIWVQALPAFIALLLVWIA
jgi:putative membrane protein